jgi:hypothetical protein
MDGDFFLIMMKNIIVMQIKNGLNPYEKKDKKKVT